MIYLVDIENIPNRYSTQWREWYINLFGKENVRVIGDQSTTIETNNNEFMSFIPSNKYKADQVAQMALYMKVGMIHEDDIVFFMDAWHPGVIALRQMMIHYPYKFQIYGYFHAGSYDENDILGPYFKYFKNFEKGLVDCLDKCLLATNYHLELMRRGLSLSWDVRDKFEVVGFLYNKDHLIRGIKEKLIVFPHRIATEKHPELFDALAKELPEYTFIKTIEATKNKAEYYGLLSKARFSISFADQETFGISMVESLLSGAIPIVPNKLSYRELYLDEFRYIPYGRDLVEMVVDMIKYFDFKANSDVDSLLDENINLMLKQISGERILDVFNKKEI